MASARAARHGPSCWCAPAGVWSRPLASMAIWFHLRSEFEDESNGGRCRMRPFTVQASIAGTTPTLATMLVVPSPFSPRYEPDAETIFVVPVKMRVPAEGADANRFECRLMTPVPQVSTVSICTLVGGWPTAGAAPVIVLV